MILIFRWSASSCDQTLLTNIPEQGKLCQILTHNQQVLTGRHCLERLLGGDLAGVVTRHVRVDIRQHHATAVTSGFLQKRFDQIRIRESLSQKYLHRGKVLAEQKTVSDLDNFQADIGRTRATLCTISLSANFDPATIIDNRIPVDEELTVSTAVPFVSDEPNASYLKIVVTSEDGLVVGSDSIWNVEVPDTD